MLCRTPTSEDSVTVLAHVFALPRHAGLDIVVDSHQRLRVACIRETVSGFCSAAPGWQDATREHPGSIRPKSTAAKWDAPPGDVLRIAVAGR